MAEDGLIIFFSFTACYISFKRGDVWNLLGECISSDFYRKKISRISSVPKFSALRFFWKMYFRLRL